EPGSAITMPFPKTMLFTPTPPGQGSVGENFLRQVVPIFPKDKLVTFSAWSTSYAIWVPAAELDWMPIECTELPEERLVGRRRGALLDKVHSYLKRPKHWQALERIVDQAVAFGKKHDVEVVFAVLASPSTIMMTRKVAQRLNARLVCMVWDPPHCMLEVL